MQNSGGVQIDLEARLLRAAVGYLHSHWPNAVTLMPSTLGEDFKQQNRLFVDIIQNLIDEGLISVEYFIVGGPLERIARETVLTRKGASERLNVLG